MRTTPALILNMLAAAVCMGAVAEEDVPVVIVSAEFRATDVLDTGSSVSVIDEMLIRKRRAQHLDEILNLAPNVNFAAGASRGRFIQIRGIGERSQFVAPLNPSVGLIIDGVDFSGIAGGATTLDIQQVEVLRGPQGTLYGANALAGLINMKSNDPTSTPYRSVDASVGDYGRQTLSGVISGPTPGGNGYRFAIQTHESDGYIDNGHLNRDDTSAFDELTARGKFRWEKSDDITVTFTGLYVDADNGYDAFSLDNTRETLSDEPGHDRQESTAFSVETVWTGDAPVDLVTLVSHASSELDYAFDEDWAFPTICAGEPCDGWQYRGFDRYQRDRDTTAIDTRFVSRDGGEIWGDTTDWLVGFYWRDQQVSLVRDLTADYREDFTFMSDYDTRNIALYGELTRALSDDTILVLGLRAEDRDADYSDSDGVGNTNAETLWGGRVALEHSTQNGNLLYALVSRGYKAGGINGDPRLPDGLRAFDTEQMWNVETGFKKRTNDGRGQFQVAFFYQTRDDVQVRQSFVIPISGDVCPCDFADYSTNAAEGTNYGIEMEFAYRPADALSFYGSLGVLQTEFDNFLSFSHVDADPENEVPVDLSGRDQAHAPSYQFAFGLEWAWTQNLIIDLSVEGKDDFYFSSRYDEQSRSYEIVNASLRYETDTWEVALWGRNLTDEDYYVRGLDFGEFGNDPRKFYEREPYFQFGEPSVVGVSGRVEF